MKKIRIAGRDYNMTFDPADGTLVRWGRTFDDDPVMCPVGPEIADIEISTICNGIGKTMAKRQPCSWCYKSNTGVGEYMSLETFKKILKSMPPTLTQIAFGIGDLDANPDMYAIMQHCRDNNVVPNVTTNGMGIDEGVFPQAANPRTHAEQLARLCGAVAVSHYGIDDTCFDAVASLSSHGLKQVNIHKLLSEETYQSCFDLIDKASTNDPTRADPRLKGLRAIVFLLLKPKGDRNTFHPIRSMGHYKDLLEYAQAKGVMVGMDSCSAPMALKSLDASCIPSIEPCESTLFSIYINVKGEVFPCSFTEGTPGWERGIDATNAVSFGKEVWYHPKLVEWRKNLLRSSEGCTGCAVQKYCRSCPVYDVTICQPKPGLGQKLVQIGG